jgi:hypothetical protein
MVRSVLVFSLMGLLLLTACAPHDLSGVYIAKRSDLSGMSFVMLTSSSPTQLSGHMTVTAVEGSHANGIESLTYPLSGTVNGSHILFFANNQQISAEMSGDGFSMLWPSGSGIQNLDFRRSSADEVNAFVAKLDKQGSAARAAYMQTATATLELTNLSSGTAEFYVDDQPSCNAPPGMHCTITVGVITTHTLSAVTAYDQSSYQTPRTNLAAAPNAYYRFESCGETGTPGQNCGLFTISNPSP